MSDTNRVLWSVWWEDAWHNGVDLIRRIWNVFKKWNVLPCDSNNSMYHFSKWAAGRNRACRVAKYSHQRLNWRPDYFVTNDSLARDTLGQCKSLWGRPLSLVWVHSHLGIFTWPSPSPSSLQKCLAKTAFNPSNKYKNSPFAELVILSCKDTRY